MIHREDIRLIQKWGEKIQNKAQYLLNSQPKVSDEVEHMLYMNIENMTYGKTKNGLVIETLRSGKNYIVIKSKRESPS